MLWPLKSTDFLDWASGGSVTYHSSEETLNQLRLLERALPTSQHHMKARAYHSPLVVTKAYKRSATYPFVWAEPPHLRGKS